ncbi:MAG: BPL-N domain-containing protein, partial [Alphaproteobacteria bacterium]|nr:BPL-N domain-containing protein [Alphaproteobacteria bacterium]
MKTLLNFFRQSQYLAIFLVSFILLTAADFDFSSSPDAPAKLAQFNARSASEGPTRLASPNELSPSGQCTPHPESAMGVSTSLVLSCETHPKMRVALYSGQGIMDKSYDYWEFALKKIFTDLEIFMISADAIKEGGLTNNNFSLLIIPGGQASLYRQDLDERAIGKMNGFIAQGGKCLAVGGGAY